MKTKTKTKKPDNVISELRSIREKVSIEIKDLNPKELKEFLKSNKKGMSVNKRKKVNV